MGKWWGTSSWPTQNLEDSLEQDNQGLGSGGQLSSSVWGSRESSKGKFPQAPTDPNPRNPTPRCQAMTRALDLKLGHRHEVLDVAIVDADMQDNDIHRARCRNAELTLSETVEPFLSD